MAKVIDKTGERYGALTVVGFHKMRNGSSQWECRCDCGKTVYVMSYNLTSGHTKSCGCIKREVSREIHSKHGKYGTRLHAVWRSMLQRCNDPGCTAYDYYGGRGVRVCDEWNDFLKFEAWATRSGYVDNAERGCCTIDRINVDGDYSPNNCRWVSQKQQMRNIRTNRILEFNGKRMPMSEWAEKVGLSTSTLYARLKLGWSVEEALTRPLRKVI